MKKSTSGGLQKTMMNGDSRQNEHGLIVDQAALQGQTYRGSIQDDSIDLRFRGLGPLMALGTMLLAREP